MCWVSSFSLPSLSIHSSCLYCLFSISLSFCSYFPPHIVLLKQTFACVVLPHGKKGIQWDVSYDRPEPERICGVLLNLPSLRLIWVDSLRTLFVSSSLFWKQDLFLKRINETQFLQIFLKVRVHKKIEIEMARSKFHLQHQLNHSSLIRMKQTRHRHRIKKKEMSMNLHQDMEGEQVRMAILKQEQIFRQQVTTQMAILALLGR